MIPYFNTSGPCVAGEHYMLPPERRLGRVMELVEQGRYFTLHAGHQTGKTTCARWLVDHYNHEGALAALWVDLEAAREQPDPAAAIRTIFNALDQWVALDLPGLGLAAERVGWLSDPATAVHKYLTDLAARAGKPIVVFFDEVDGLVGPTMVSFLTQLRAGYIGRSRSPFPHSVALVGRRQVRDYVLATDERRAVAWLGTTSPFNITAEAQTLAPFTAAEVAELLGQHTAATGQRFAPEAAALIHELSAGHPWLVNALADQATLDVRDRARTIEAAQIETAKETIILERRTHIDSLAARLRESRVQRIVEPMLLGNGLPDGIDEDLQYVAGLGLIRVEAGQWRVANPIYREVIPRVLTFATQTSLYQETPWYLRPDGSLDLAKLLAEFQEFWREDGHLAAEGFHYREAGPHLVLMAFLQRVVNGGGRVEREYGLGRGRLDLIVEWRGERQLIELKLRRGKRAEERALAQLARYLDGAGLAEGWLVLFDLRKEIPWAEKLTTRAVEIEGKRITVLGC